jgi:Tol biopolymer transport system component
MSFMLTLTENTKRLLFIGFFIIFSIGTGYALYYFFFRPSTPTIETPTQEDYAGNLNQAGQRGPVTPSQETGGSTLPGAGTNVSTTAPVQEAGEVTLLRDAVTQAVSPSSKGGTRYYNPEDGRFYRINDDGTLTLLSDRQFINVENVSWGKSSDEAILGFPDGSNIYYNFEDQQQTSLPSHWSDFDFAPQDQSVVAKSIGLDEGNRFLITSEPDGNGATAVYHMGQNADLVIPSWSPNNQVIAFSRTGAPQADNAEQIYLLGKNHEDYKALTVPGRGFVPNWSTSGKRLLYSVYHERDNDRPMLWVSEASGQDIGKNRQKLNLMTWADKCVWSNDNEIFCAVPIDLPAGAGYDKSRFTDIPDNVYYINLETGLSKKINSTDQNHPISQPVLSQDHSKLIFTDSITGKLYSYKLTY